MMPATTSVVGFRFFTFRSDATIMMSSKLRPEALMAAIWGVELLCQHIQLALNKLLGIELFGVYHKGFRKDSLRGCPLGVEGTD